MTVENKKFSNLRCNSKSWVEHIFMLVDQSKLIQNTENLQKSSLLARFEINSPIAILK